MTTFTKLLLAAGLVTLGSRAASAQVLYDNFENTRLVSYPYTGGAFTPNAPNPGSNAVNSSSTCASYVRSNAAYDVIVIKPTAAPGKMADVAAYAAGTKKISVKFRSPAAGIAMQLVLQNTAKASTNLYPQGNFGGTFDTKTTVANAWETLTFTYTPGAAGTFDPTVTSTDVDQMVLLIAPNTTATPTCYLDDIMGPELVTGTVAAPILLDNFEGTRLVNYPTVQGTLNVAAPNPGSNAVNSSTTCASYVRDGSQPYATIVIQPKSGKFGDVSGYATGTQKITLKFRSPAANTAVQIVLQNKAKTANNYPNGNFGGTFDAKTTGTNTWETLTFTYTAGAAGTFDPSVLATDVDQIALLIAPGSTSNSSTYYFDDLTGPAFATVTATRVASTSTGAFAPAYPNPATGLTHLPYSLQKAAVVSLAVYDAMGRRVASVLESEARPAGDHTADLRTTNLAPGLYTCRLVVDGVALTRPLNVE